MRAYIDGAAAPEMLSSGLEDYFLGTYYFNRGQFANGLAGLTHLNPQHSTFSAYRFHDQDPLFFHTGLRLTCKCGEKVGNKAFGDPPPTESHDVHLAVRVAVKVACENLKPIRLNNAGASASQIPAP